MEIKTCEQYVLAELEEAKKSVDNLVDRNIEQATRLIEAQKTIDELDSYILKVTRTLEDLYKFIRQKELPNIGFSYHLDIDDYNAMDVAYEKATEILNKERESDSEE